MPYICLAACKIVVGGLYLFPDTGHDVIAQLGRDRQDYLEDRIGTHYLGQLIQLPCDELPYSPFLLIFLEICRKPQVPASTETHRGGSLVVPFRRRR
jgi:hypothetical protein